MIGGVEMALPPQQVPWGVKGKLTARIVAEDSQAIKLLFERDEPEQGPNANTAGVVCLAAWLLTFWSLRLAGARWGWALLFALLGAGAAWAAMRYLPKA
jgi:hypothetical protein